MLNPAADRYLQTDYGSGGWEFESLRARQHNRLVLLADLTPSGSYRITKLDPNRTSTGQRGGKGAKRHPTTHYRYKRPSRKRAKAAVIEQAVVSTTSGDRHGPEAGGERCARHAAREARPPRRCRRRAVPCGRQGRDSSRPVSTMSVRRERQPITGTTDR